MVPSASLQHQAGGRQTEAHRRHQEKHERSHCQVRGKGAIAHCTPTCSILQAGACLAKMQATSGQRRSSEQNASCMAARRQANSGASMTSESHEQSQGQERRRGAAARGIPTSSVLQLELARAKRCRPFRIAVEQQAEGVGMAARTCQMRTEGRGGEKDLCCNIVMVAPLR